MGYANLNFFQKNLNGGIKWYYILLDDVLALPLSA